MFEKRHWRAARQASSSVLLLFVGQCSKIISRSEIPELYGSRSATFLMTSVVRTPRTCQNIKRIPVFSFFQTRQVPQVRESQPPTEILVFATFRGFPLQGQGVPRNNSHSVAISGLKPGLPGPGCAMPLLPTAPAVYICWHYKAIVCIWCIVCGIASLCCWRARPDEKRTTL